LTVEARSASGRASIPSFICWKRSEEAYPSTLMDILFEIWVERETRRRETRAKITIKKKKKKERKKEIKRK